MMRIPKATKVTWTQRTPVVRKVTQKQSGGQDAIIDATVAQVKTKCTALTGKGAKHHDEK